MNKYEVNLHTLNGSILCYLGNDEEHAIKSFEGQKLLDGESVEFLFQGKQQAYRIA